MFQFPFGTMHQLNLDWFLGEWENYKQEWADAQAGIDNALQGEIDRVEDAMTDLYNARDVAVQAKEDAETAAGSAVSDAAQAGADALKSEGYAVGEQDGIPVGSGSPYYQQNAKYYKVEAGTYRYLSEAYAKGEMGGSPVAPGEAGYQDNAKYYKEAADLDASTASSAAASADADALKAEGYAVGEQNGVLVSPGDPYYQDNAKYYYQQTAQDKADTDTLKDAANAAALRAEGWSSGTQNGTPVASGSPYYENNAFYYFSNTANIDGQNSQKMISASEENTTTAAYVHYKGSFFRLAGKMYLATADIAVGDTITDGTNCAEIDVGMNMQFLETHIKGITNTIPLRYKKGYYTTSQEGSAVTYNSINPSWVCTDYPVNPGDIITIYGAADSATTRLYVFTDENDISVGRSNANLNGIYQVVAPANAKHIYINNKLATIPSGYYAFIGYDTFMATAKLITPYIENTFVASRSYLVDQLIIIQKSLYKAVANIASGAAFTVGTNIIPTTIAEELYALI